MLIIAGKVYVAPGERDRYVESQKDLIQQARSAAGCLDLTITADPIEPGRVNMFELWESEATLAAFREGVNAPPDEIAIVRDEVQKFQISSVGPPF